MESAQHRINCKHLDGYIWSLFLQVKFIVCYNDRVSGLCIENIHGAASCFVDYLALIITVAGLNFKKQPRSAVAN